MSWRHNQCRECRLSHGHALWHSRHILAGLNLLKKGSTADNCIKWSFFVRFQNNKKTAAKFCALQYNYSFRNSMWSMYRNRNEALNRIKMKLAMFTGSNLKLLDMPYQECYVGWQKSLSGIPHTNPSVGYGNRNLRGGQQESIPENAPAPVPKWQSSWLTPVHSALNECTPQCLWHCSDQPVTSCHRGHDTGVIFCLLQVPNSFSHDHTL